MSYIENDDDLFEYDPAEDTQETISYNSIDKNESTIDGFINTQKFKIDDLDLSTSKLIDENKVNLAQSFHSATSHYFAKVNTPTYEKSVSIVLDRLTNGDFSLINMFHKTEAKITQRILFLDLMERIVAPLNDEDTFSLRTILNLLKIEHIEEHLSIFYLSSMNICRHALAIDRAVYEHLGAQLDMPVNPNLIDPYYPVNAADLNNPVVNNYPDTVYSKIIKTISHDGLLKKLTDTFGRQMELFSNEE